MKCAIIILLQFFLLSATQAQEVTRYLIVKDKGDSTLVNAEQCSFDRSGNYSFVLKTDTGGYLFTNKNTIGPLRSLSSKYTNDAHYWVGYDKHQPDNMWYTGNFGLTTYGPAKGKITSAQVSAKNDCIAVELRRGDTVSKIINGTRVGSRIDKETDNYEEKKWCTFSNNGHALYYIEKGGEYIIYLDTFELERSRNHFSKLAVNDRGDYMYLETTQRKVSGKNPLSYLHLKDTTIGPINGSFSSLKLQANGGYYAFDEENQTLVINNTLYTGIMSVDRIILPDSKNYLFSYIKANDTGINVNGRWYHHHVYDVEKMAIDEKGNFAYYMLKDYYLYKVINGVVEKKPLSKYGVRARPLYISPFGASIHYFATDDSAYLYRDEELVFPPIHQRRTDDLIYYKNFDYFNNGKINDKLVDKLSGIVVDSTTLYIINGALSKALHNDGYISFDSNDRDFFSIKRMNAHLFHINLNNQKEIEIEADALFINSYYFDENKLILFGREGLSFYKYTIKL